MSKKETMRERIERQIAEARKQSAEIGERKRDELLERVRGAAHTAADMNVEKNRTGPKKRFRANIESMLEEQKALKDQQKRTDSTIDVAENELRSRIEQQNELEREAGRYDTMIQGGKRYAKERRELADVMKWPEFARMRPEMEHRTSVGSDELTEQHISPLQIAALGALPYAFAAPAFAGVSPVARALSGAGLGVATGAPFNAAFKEGDPIQDAAMGASFGLHPALGVAHVAHDLFADRPLVGTPEAHGMYVGEKVRPGLKKLFQKARDLASLGKSSEEIWDATKSDEAPILKAPWNDDFMAEISDRGVDFRDNRKKQYMDTLENVMYHPELFPGRGFDHRAGMYWDKAPGALKEVPTSIDLKRLSGRMGVFQPSVKPWPIGSIRVSAMDKEDGLSTLLHEVQHAIQNLEGHAPGYKREDANRLVTNLRGALDNNDDNLLNSVPNPVVNRLFSMEDSNWFSPETIHQIYQDAAGETMARSTQRRSTLSDDFRRKIYPLANVETENVWDPRGFRLWDLQQKASGGRIKGALERVRAHMEDEPVRKGVADIIKEPGGQWLPGNIERLIEGISYEGWWRGDSTANKLHNMEGYTLMTGQKPTIVEKADGGSVTNDLMLNLLDSATAQRTGRPVA